MTEFELPDFAPPDEELNKLTNALEILWRIWPSLCIKIERNEPYDSVTQPHSNSQGYWVTLHLIADDEAYCLQHFVDFREINGNPRVLQAVVEFLAHRFINALLTRPLLRSND